MSRQKGSTLVEILITLAIMGATGGAVVVDSVSIHTDERTEIEQIALGKAIADCQVDYIQRLPFSEDDSYPAVDSPPGYTAQIMITDISPEWDLNSLQKVVVTIFRNEQAIYTTEFYKSRE